jgi:hypothetical protein
MTLGSLKNHAGIHHWNLEEFDRDRTSSPFLEVVNPWGSSKSQDSQKIRSRGLKRSRGLSDKQDSYSLHDWTTSRLQNSAGMMVTKILDPSKKISKESN